MDEGTTLPHECLDGKCTHGTRTFTIELTKDELTILHYVMPRDWGGSFDGDPLKDTYELHEDEPEDPYATLRTLVGKIGKLAWPKAGG